MATTPALFAAAALSLLGPVCMGAIDLDGGTIAGALVTQIILTSLTWIIAAKVTAAVLTTKVAQLTRDVEHLSRSVAAISADRTACELRSTKNYATWEGLATFQARADVSTKDILAAISSSAQEARDLNARVHARVDDIVQRLARLEERTDG
jgi:hypothetical protein